MNTQIPVRQSLAELSLDDLTDKMAEMGNSNIQTCQAEFLRRQTVLQKDTAEYTRRNARYMLWSVIVLAISSVISTMVTVVVALLHH